MTVEELLNLKQSFADKYNKQNKESGNKLNSIEIYCVRDDSLIDLPTDLTATLDISTLFMIVNIIVSKDYPMLSKVYFGKDVINTLDKTFK